MLQWSILNPLCGQDYLQLNASGALLWKYVRQTMTLLS